MASGADPNGIVLLTFTHRAARSMVSRIKDLLGRDANGVRAGTFHGLAAAALAPHAEALGYRLGFTVIEQGGQRALAAEALADAGLTSRGFAPARVIEVLGLAVATERRLADVIAHRAPHMMPRYEQLELALAGYTARKLAANVMDFDDLLLGWRARLADGIDFGAEHVLVDEYQDATPIQAAIALGLAGDRGTLCVVGDDAQSIYGFRGAQIETLNRFRASGAHVRTLTESFRSSPEICAVANAVIENRLELSGKKLVATRPAGDPVVLVDAGDPAQQAQFIAQRAGELCDGGVPLSEQAVLYRSHGSAAAIAAALDARGLRSVVATGPADNRPVQLEMGDSGAITLSTVHRAKGLEWRAVFVAGLSAGAFPPRYADDMAEERRLLHVAITRAQDYLHLVAPDPASPFFNELAGRAGLCERWSLA